MKNHFIDTLRWAGLSLAAVAMAALTACTNEDNATEPSAGARTYTVCIPASLNEGAQTRAVSFSGTECTSTFVETDEIYVYNATKTTMLEGYLTPTSISADGKKCSLEGTLTGNIAAGNKLTLFYNMNGYDSENDPAENSYYYGYQDGTADGALDGAMATVTVSNYSGGTLTTTATASFTNLQSMFRFQFQDESSNAITVKGLKIESKNNENDALPSIYYPLKSGAEQYYTDYISVIPATATSDYLYVALCIDENASASELTFTVTGSNDKVYQGSKDAPTAGFKNGNYYYNTAPIALTYQYQLQKPTITWTRCDYDPEPNPVDFFWTVRGTWNDALDDYNNDIDFTLSGTSYGYIFIMDYAGTVRLNGLNATMVNNNFIQCNGGDLTVDITGANTITCKDVSNCISASQNLKLSGSGTLTVTAKGEYYCGLWGDNNYTDANNSYETTTAMDVSAQLAADGFKVTRSAMTDNADGTYTWTYTVEPIPLAVKHAGESTYTAVTGDIELADGDVLTGMLDGNYKISIENDATVTLNGVTIIGTNDDSYEWAGITCEGDATIILADGSTNTVKGFDKYYPGIYVPENQTLTIKGETNGTGKLDASSNGEGAGIGSRTGEPCGNIEIQGGIITATGGFWCAGIGSGHYGSCGDITISGGIINAKGGENGACIGSGGNGGRCGNISISGGTVNITCGNVGIGSGGNGGRCGNISISGGNITCIGDIGIGAVTHATCGDITINGGTVTATGNEGPGIGSYDGGSCGKISITSPAQVTATKGSWALNSIGRDDDSTCGTVTIGGTEFWTGSAYANGGDTYLTQVTIVFPAP